MSQLIVLVARHGRTFRPGEKSVYLGRHQDMPLSAEGLADAEQLNRALLSLSLPLVGAWCSPLLRTRQTTDLALRGAAKGQIEICVDERLSELDYGRWANQSAGQLEAAGFGQALADWQSRAVWPALAGFSPDRQTVVSELQAVFADVASQGFDPVRAQAALVVSHGGRLRLLCDALGCGDNLVGHEKLGCGRLAVLRYTEGGWQRLAWDLFPAAQALKKAIS